MRIAKEADDTVALRLTLVEVRALARSLGYQMVPTVEGPLHLSSRYSNVRALFHKAWGQATSAPTYNKKLWMDLDNALMAIIVGKE